MEKLGPDPDSLNTFRLETARLVMAPPEPGHVSGLFEMAGGRHRHEITAGLMWEGPDRIEDIEMWVGRCQATTFGESGYSWVILQRSPDGDGARPVGTISLRPHHFPGRATVGYWLGKELWGKGMMYEALSEVISFAFGPMRVAKLEAEVFAPNRAGRRLVEKVGMTQEALIRRAVYKRGEWLDEAIYGLLVEEWPQVSAQSLIT